jgi:hypothetical protein
VNWFRVDVAFALSPEFMELPAELQAAWLRLHASAAKYELGGAIPACRSWTRRQWDRAAGVTPALVTRLVEAKLTGWSGPDGADLTIFAYDHEGEAKAHGSSEKARKAAEERWRRHAQASVEQVPEQCASNARNGTLRDDTRRNGTEVGSRAAARPSATTPDATKSVREPSAGRRVTDHFAARYRERTGAAPTWKDQHFANLKRLLQQHDGDAELLIAHVDVLFDAPPRFLAGSTPDFDTFIQHFDKLATPAATHAGPNGAAMSGDQLRAMAAEMRARGVP